MSHPNPTSNPHRGRPVEILLVEDNPGDIRLVQEVFKSGRIANHLHVVTDGEQAMTFLRQEGPYAGMARPDIILLDLNLPRRNGREVLSDIKNDPELCVIPVVVLTSSQTEQDILRAYQLHASCYLTKPVDLQGFFNVMDSLQDFWLTWVKLPPLEA
ncbi:MAG: response regulator [Chromatiales bacterium]|jgi:CheY-like chemotaxis protein|nr:response regulator [Chromatiales bacterium]MDX9768206.1 response regulator [Ectothiorhodospiraceae bacterium]